MSNHHYPFTLDKLMVETRRIAAEFYTATGKTLPVSNEIAKYDAGRLLHLHVPKESIAGVDMVDDCGQLIQIKSRVILNPKKLTYRIGQLNFEGKWQQLLLVIMNKEYLPLEIYAANRSLIEKELDQKASSESRLKRGAMSINKFKMISELVWEQH